MLIDEYNYYLYFVSGIVWVFWILCLLALAFENLNRTRYQQLTINLCFAVSFSLRVCYYWGNFYQFIQVEDPHIKITRSQEGLISNRVNFALIVLIFQTLGISTLMFSWLKFLNFSNSIKKRLHGSTFHGSNNLLHHNSKSNQSFASRQRLSVTLLGRDNFASVDEPSFQVIEYKSLKLKYIYDFLYIFLILGNVGLWIGISYQLYSDDQNSNDFIQTFPNDLRIVSAVTLTMAFVMIVMSSFLADSLLTEVIDLDNSNNENTLFTSYTNIIVSDDSSSLLKVYYRFLLFYALAFRRRTVAPEIFKPERVVLHNVFSTAIILTLIFFMRFGAALFAYKFVSADPDKYNRFVITTDVAYNICFPWLVMEIPEILVSGIINLSISPLDGAWRTRALPFLNRICCCKSTEESTVAIAEVGQLDPQSVLDNALYFTTTLGSDPILLYLDDDIRSTVSSVTGRQSQAINADVERTL
jgi:hypothetical protein